ncbi:phage holin family protein [Caballeronia glathei]|uniref:Phage holin family protein n=1 Tax=Caballeronia glathei TaxID=60547 RepID=A0A069PAA7_9BURK|nr:MULTISPECIES: phage holin family protein [Burkholderiaceae]KDR37598.1 hypothetical protein BG61_11495 [Caballeronia glathei]TCK33619.1 putative membrane protein YqjE [Paraburkholderia sp. BL8N3]
MTVQSKIAQWRNVGRLLSRRIGDYSELFRIELAETKSRLLHEVVAMVALAIGALFMLSFFCIAVIITAAGTPYFVAVAWGVAAVWLLVTLVAGIVMRSRRPSEPFQTLRTEVECDLKALSEANK